jgi:SAM-dependent methyltransferase
MEITKQNILENAKSFFLPQLKPNDLIAIELDNCSSVNILFEREDVEKIEQLMIKKGNCSTNEAVDKIVDGTAYSSHALPFYLYNFSALKIIENICKSNSNMTMVELGANNGLVSRLLGRNGFKFQKYFGIDFDFSFIIDGLWQFNETDNQFPKYFMQGDFNKPLIFKDGSVDFVYFQEAFDHCRDKYFYSERLLSEINRILKPDGLLYITLVFEHEYRDLYHWDHNYIWSKDEFESVVSDYFDIVKFNSLLTFEHVLYEQALRLTGIQKVINNWPIKLAKQMCASFVPERDAAVGAYLLRKKFKKLSQSVIERYGTKNFKNGDAKCSN